MGLEFEVWLQQLDLALGAGQRSDPETPVDAEHNPLPAACPDQLAGRELSRRFDHASPPNALRSRSSIAPRCGSAGGRLKT